MVCEAIKPRFEDYIAFGSPHAQFAKTHTNSSSFIAVSSDCLQSRIAHRYTSAHFSPKDSLSSDYICEHSSKSLSVFCFLSDTSIDVNVIIVAAVIFVVAAVSCVVVLLCFKRSEKV